MSISLENLDNLISPNIITINPWNIFIPKLSEKNIEVEMQGESYEIISEERRPVVFNKPVIWDVVLSNANEVNSSYNLTYQTPKINLNVKTDYIDNETWTQNITLETDYEEPYYDIGLEIATPNADIIEINPEYEYNRISENNINIYIPELLKEEVIILKGEIVGELNNSLNLTFNLTINVTINQTLNYTLNISGDFIYFETFAKNVYSKDVEDWPIILKIDKGFEGLILDIKQEEEILNNFLSDYQEFNSNSGNRPDLFSESNLRQALSFANIKHTISLSGKNETYFINQKQMEINEKKKLIEELHPEGFKAEIQFQDFPIKSIEFKDIVIKNSTIDFGIEEVDLKDKGYIQSYAIDPVKLNFTNATVTVTAKGNNLYKCKEWNFTNQTCYGEWELFKEDLIPGQEYSFMLDPDDPAFGEIVITRAEHLDENRSFISNIYEEVKVLDDIWSENISDGEYVRVRFAINLTSQNDITIFPRITSGNPIIEVYEINSSELIANFGLISSNEYNKVYLTNLEGEQDSFDLKIVGGSVGFDLIIDPLVKHIYDDCNGVSINQTRFGNQTTAGDETDIYATGDGYYVLDSDDAAELTLHTSGLKDNFTKFMVDAMFGTDLDGTGRGWHFGIGTGVLYGQTGCRGNTGWVPNSGYFVCFYGDNGGTQLYRVDAGVETLLFDESTKDVTTDIYANYTMELNSSGVFVFINEALWINSSDTTYSTGYITLSTGGGNSNRGNMSINNVWDYDVINVPPTHTTPILTSTYGTNFTNENLTCYNQSTSDLDGDSVKNVFNWYLEGQPVTLLNMPFEGGSNLTQTRDYAQGLSGTVHDLAIWNQTGGYDGKGAYDFNTTTYVEVDYDSSLNSDTFTISLWARVDGSAGNYRSPITSRDDGPQRGYIIYATNSNVWSFWMGTGSAWSSYNGAAVSSDWTHVVATYNGTHKFFYLDGQLQGSPQASAYSKNTARPLRIGAGRTDSTPDYYFDGPVDDVLIFNRSLSAEQITELYHNKTNLIVSQETSIGNNWSCKVTPNDGNGDGTTLSSNNLIISTDNPPTVNLDIPIDNYVNDTARYVNLTLNASVSDHKGLVNCSLWHNISGTWARNETIIVGGTTNTTEFTSNSLTNVRFIWNIQCYDNNNQSAFATANRSVILNWTDRDVPLVYLTSPSNGASISTYENITFNVTASDSAGMANCTLWTNLSDSWQKNDTKTFSGISDSDSWILENVSSGQYKWNAYCCDVNDNCEWNNTNFTLSITRYHYPEAEDVWLNATTWKNFTEDDLTVHYAVTDEDTADSGNLVGVVDWKLDGNSLNILNIPFTRSSNNNYTKEYAYGLEGNGTNTIFNNSDVRYGMGSYDFSTANAVLTINDNDLNKFIPADNFTFMAWVKFYSTPSAAFAVVIEKGYADNFLFSIGALNGGNMMAALDTGVGENDCNSGFDISDGSWHHIAATYDHTMIRTFVDGLERNTCPETADLNLVSHPWSIGSEWRPGENPYWQSDAEVSGTWVIRRALSIDEIKQYYTGNYSVMLSNETKIDDQWQACLTPNDAVSDGIIVCSNTLDILGFLDLFPPNVSLMGPTDETLEQNTRTPQFQFNVTEEYAENITCWLNITTAGSGSTNILATNNSVLNNTPTNMTPESNLADGYYDWNVICYDGRNNATSTETWQINISVADTISPNIKLRIPGNDTLINESFKPIFYFNVTDNKASVVTCDLIIDDGTEFYAGTESVPVDTNINITSNTTLLDGIYDWYVNCTDGSMTNISQKWTFNLTYSDVIVSDINIILPQNNSIEYSGTYRNYNFSVTDNENRSSGNLTCTVYYEDINTGSGGNYGSLYNVAQASTLSIQGTQSTTMETNWWVNCTDKAGNIGKSEVRRFTYYDTVWLDDMEPGHDAYDGNWNETASTGSETWGVQNSDVYGGDYMYADSPNAEYPAAASETHAIAPVMDLRKYYSANITLYHKYNIHMGATCNDALIVEASVDGSTYNSLTPVYGSYTSIGSGTNPRVGENGFCGVQATYTKEAFDLASYVGNSTVYIRLTMVTDASTSRPGYDMDNVLLFGVEDNVDPNVTLSKPQIAYVNDTVAKINVTFECNTSDDYNLYNVSLYLTNSTNQSFSINTTTSIIGTDNVTNWTIELIKGDYTWNCLVNDAAGNYDWGNVNRSIKLNYSYPPTVNLDLPIDNYVNDTARYVNLTLNASVSDDDGLINCSLWHNITGWSRNDTNTVGGTTNKTEFTLNGLTNVSFIWNIQCYDIHDKYGWGTANRSVTLNWTDRVYPAVQFESPTYDNDTAIKINYSFINVSITEQYLDNVWLDWNGTDEDLSCIGTLPNYICSVNKTGLTEGIYTYKAYANDTSNNINSTETRTLLIDFTNPEVFDLRPIAADNFTYQSSVIVSANVTDNNDIDEVYANISWNFGASSQLIELIKDGVTNKYNHSFTSTNYVGVYNVTIIANDTANNINNTEATWFNITRDNPDMFISGITFSNNDPIEGQNIWVYINVTNNVSFNSGNFTVLLNISLWNGTKTLNESLTSDYLDIGADTSQLVNFSWVVKIGTYIFDAKADIYNNITETNETNNNRTENISVSAWEILYGNYSYNLKLGSYNNDTYMNWTPTTPRGNLYYYDYDSSFYPFNLRPLNQSGDIAQADSALGLTGFNDSLVRLFDRNLDGLADDFITVEISGSDIENIPIINSTSGSDFITGILYDSADGAGGYDGSQDLIFISVINASASGKYGTYDYEVRVPAKLDELKAGADLVTRLDELK